MSSLRPLLVLLCLTAPCHAGDKIFKDPPRTTRMGEQSALTFALKEATDVEIAVLDGKGHIARHLAAGVLGGKNPPPSPLQPGLTQKLLWEGKGRSGETGSGRSLPIPSPGGNLRAVRPTDRR